MKRLKQSIVAVLCLTMVLTGTVMTFAEDQASNEETSSKKALEVTVSQGEGEITLVKNGETIAVTSENPFDGEINATEEIEIAYEVSANEQLSFDINGAIVNDSPDITKDRDSYLATSETGSFTIKAAEDSKNILINATFTKKEEKSQSAEKSEKSEEEKTETKQREEKAAVVKKAPPAVFAPAPLANTYGTVTRAYQEFGPFGSSWWSFGVSSGTFSSSDAICAATFNMSIPTPGQSVTMQKLSAADERTKLAYYAYLGHNQTMEDRWHLNQCASKLSGNGIISTSADAYYIEAMKVTVPANFEAYYCVPDNGAQTILAWRINPKGNAKLKKTSANPAITNGNSCYSLAGAKYGVYKTVADATQKKNAVATLTTNSAGTSNTITLDPGTYYVRETNAPKGYEVDNQIHRVTVTSGKTATINVKDMPTTDPLPIVLQKTATGSSYLNDADMSDAIFTVKYYPNSLATGTPKTWRLKTVKNLSGLYVSGLTDEYILPGSDEVFRNSAGDPAIPLGTVTIQEEQAPKGYEKDNTVYTYKVELDSFKKIAVYNFGATPQHPNTPLTPKIKTTARDAVTDSNISACSKNAKLYDTVSYEGLVEDEEYTSKGILMDRATGKPLLVNGKEVRAEKTFTVTKDNSTITGSGASGSVDLEYRFDSSALAGKTTVIYEKLYYKGKEIAAHEDINDDFQTVYFADLKTTASIKEVGKPIGKRLTIIDRVKYININPGKEYTVKGVLMDKNTGKPFLENGKEVRAEKTFTPKDRNGFVELEFSINSNALKGNTIVVFETLYEDDKEIITHTDINDVDQSVSIGRLTVDFPYDGYPKTGDNTDITVALIGLLLSAGLLIYLLNKGKGRRYKRDEEV